MVNHYKKYNVMEAMKYEHLIRSVFKSGRTHKNGADADIYRKMDIAFIELEMKLMSYTQDEREINFNQSFIPVKNNIHSAITKAKELVKYKAAPDDLNQIDSVLKEMDFRFYDKERLDEIIDNMGDLIFKYIEN